MKDYLGKEQRYYFINAACVRWMKRTGRPMIEWLWEDDLDTRLQDELVEKPKNTGDAPPPENP